MTKQELSKELGIGKPRITQLMLLFAMKNGIDYTYEPSERSGVLRVIFTDIGLAKLRARNTRIGAVKGAVRKVGGKLGRPGKKNKGI